MKRAHIWPFMIVAAVFAASSQSQLATPKLDFGFSVDKLAHFLVFGLLATSILRIPRFIHMGWHGAMITIVLVSLYGICDEYRQSLTPGRTVGFADWVYDTAGAIVASILYLQSMLWRSVLEWQPWKASKKCQPQAAHNKPTESA